MEQFCSCFKLTYAQFPVPFANMILHLFSVNYFPTKEAIVLEEEKGERQLKFGHIIQLLFNNSIFTLMCLKKVSMSVMASR